MGFYTLLLLALQILLVRCQTLSYKLPEDVLPTSYLLTLETDLDNLKFNGSVTINVNVKRTMNSFSLHSKELTIDSIKLSQSNNVISTTKDFTPERDLLNIYSSTALQGEYKLEINYQGDLGRENIGYYRAFYMDANNVNKTLAVTHLEATNARRAFPCFDQPNFKAQFEIILIRRSHQVTSSNMLLLNSLPLYSDKVQDTYEKSPLMSTYLVAFMVSEYGSISIIEDGKTYRTFARPELLRRGDPLYSLDIAPAAIRQMETFTGFPYPIKKMDQVPVPNDYYNIGAMENWGMVTYKERMLMYNNELSTAQEKQSVATIIVHEFAHQWFGDLVTPEWWTYIWLNEGFATYFEQYITSLIETEWDLMEQFITANVQPAFDDDALEGSRPMRREVETPEEIKGIYDTIVYEKAGSVIRMMEDFLGAAIFQKGLQNYLKSLSYKNTNPNKLYDNLQAAWNNPNFNLTVIMESWETQPGYPVVTVTRNYSSSSVTLKQERFYSNGKSGSDTSTWMIPLNYFTQTTTATQVTWFNTPTSSMALGIGAKDWVIFNKNRKGFYRVNYDETNWLLITDYVKGGDFKVIPVENRAQLIDDAFNLARSRRLNYTVAMELGTYITNETHYVPISTFNNVVSFLDRLSTGYNHHDDLKEYAIDILTPIYNKLGFTISSSDSHLNKLTKVNVNSKLCHYGHENCLDESEKFLLSWLNGTKIQPDMQTYVYCYGMKRTNQTQFNVAKDMYTTSRDDTERARIATALGCAGNTTILNNLLRTLLTENILTQTDKFNAISSVYTNNYANGVHLVLEFLTTNFADVNTKIGNTARIISGVAARISTIEQLVKLRAFENQHNATMTQELRNTVTAAKQTASNNIAWITDNKSDLELYLNSGSIVTISSILLLVCVFINYAY